MNPPSSQIPNFTAPGSRRRTPPKGILKKNNTRNTEAVTTELTMASKNLVMGQVKILKRGEALNTVLKEVNDRKVSDGAAATPEKRLVDDREVPIGGRRVLPPKKKDKNWGSRFEASKGEDVVLCSTDRLGPDPEIVSKQMKNISDCFAGSAFSDSPPPSSVPLPGFFRKNLVAPVKEDATTNLRRILGLSLV
ncbi:hypothetical protein L6452_24868 [Arctium lappa]|uniref:Uncharacterized protein n=1 Tax=Arctium lappa TaxID=4217 RepID=A0ACB9AA39_ARCLA|nr:hypothetical protein L6452_24868 [Arctium lappa]